jgi:hypothetical protein
MIDYEVWLSVWAWDKKGKFVESYAIWMGPCDNESDVIQQAKDLANTHWTNYPSKVFNKEIQINQGHKSLRKTLMTVDNFRK